MFAQFPLIQVILLAHVSLVLNINVENNALDKNLKDDTIFSDVIRNISRVNNILQELIHNYEQIQKLYDNKSFEEEYSSETEIDEVFQRNGRKKRKKNKRITQRPTEKDFPGTPMIVSEGSKSVSESMAESTEESTSGTVTQPKNVRSETASATRKVQEPTVSNKNPKKEKHHELDKKNQFEILLLGTTKKESTRDNKKIRSLLVTIETPNKNVEPYSRTSKEIQKNPKINMNLTKNVRKIVYSESFPTGKIWKEIANKKPIKLRADGPARKSKNINFRRQKSVVIFSKHKSKPRHPTSSESEEPDQGMDKDVFKTNILRAAYGEACTKLVVKKCHRACKATNKLVCKLHKCKAAFKDHFITSAKSTCINEFRRQNGDHNNNNDNDTFYATMKNRIGENYEFVDLTRQGFPAEACYPFMTPAPVEKQGGFIKPIDKAHDKEVNILRDRYEKACQKASTEKCETACTSASKSACDTYQCAKRKKRAYKKHCRKKCKDVYRYKSLGKKDSSSSSSSDSDSDTDSDSDSDSD